MTQTTGTSGLRTMRRVATGLLVFVTILYVIMHRLEATHAWAGFVRAFAEAAMVGALADWFAVTALFRHPLGLPIPHTAVIPRSKDRIGQGLGRFVEENFLAPQVIAERLKSADLVGSIAGWMANASNSATAAGGLMHAFRTTLRALPEDEVQQLLRDYVEGRMERIQLAPLAGRILEVIMAQQRHGAAVDAILHRSAELIREYEPELRKAVGERTAWLWRRLSVDQKISDRLLTVMEETMRQAAEDPEHAVRTRIDDVLHSLAKQLTDSPVFFEKGEQLKRLLIGHPAFGEHLGAMAQDLVHELKSPTTQPDEAMMSRLGGLGASLARTVIADPALNEELNRVVRSAVIQVFELQKIQAAQLIADTVKQWDAEVLSSRMEAAIGKDLQYIRVNGTLIGGLVGVLIYCASKFLHP